VLPVAFFFTTTTRPQRKRWTIPYCNCSQIILYCKWSGPFRQWNKWF